MDPYSFLRNIDSRDHFLNGLNGLNPLSTLSGLNLELPTPVNVRGKGKVAREEAALESKIVQIICSGDWEPLKPNSGKAISIGEHQICVAFREDKESGFRVWEWHGHLLMFDEENGYSPEYVYGNYFQPLEKKKKDDGAFTSIGDPATALGLGSILTSDDKKKKKQPQHTNILHGTGSRESARD